MAVRCEWCRRPSENLKTVFSLGTKYSICEQCYEANEEEICIKCGKPISAQGSIKGMCYGCSQAEYSEKQRKIEEMALGIDGEILGQFTSTLEFTEEDYERWVTFGARDITPEQLRKAKREWIKIKLKEDENWTDKLIEDNIEALEELLNRHMSKLVGKKCRVVYHGPDSKFRIRQFIDTIGNVYIIPVE